MTTTSVEKVNGTPVASAEPRFDPLALAKAEAIRTEADAKATAMRIEAEGKAAAEKTKAAAEAEKQSIANERQRMQMEQRQAEHLKKLAEITAEREEIERRAEAARKKAEAEEQAMETAAQEVEAAEGKWRNSALGFYIVCAVVALPVQIAAFYDPRALWLMAAPLMLEGGAAVVLKGAAAAVATHRSHWHYRLIAWLLAFIAAGINLWHGLAAFDPATAIGTAFASVAGPGVWDLHEHGRIRKRDGKLTRRERRALKAEQRKVEAAQAAAAKEAKDARDAAEKAAEEARQQLAADRERDFSEIWQHARKLAAALGETTVTEAVWRRAHKDIEGTDPGESVDIIRGRNIAARRVEAALSEAPGKTPVKAASSQRGSQMPPATRTGPRTGPTVRGIRRRGDTPKYVAAARTQASITAKSAADKQS